MSNKTLIIMLCLIVAPYLALNSVPVVSQLKYLWFRRKNK